MCIRDRFGIKPTRDWEKYIDPTVINNERVNISKTQLRIKERGEKQAARINKSNTITKFEVGDKVLIRTQTLRRSTKYNCKILRFI